MVVNLIAIGNSKGIRLSKSILKQCKVEDRLEILIHNSTIILKPIRKNPRENWAAEFKKMSEQGADKLLIDDTLPNEFDSSW